MIGPEREQQLAEALANLLDRRSTRSSIESEADR
jgi:hypothetical protein